VTPPAEVPGTWPAGELTVMLALGTDHHRCDRTVDWIDDWIDGQASTVHLVAQVGTSRPSRHGSSHQLMAPPDLHAALAAADVVVCHGGPATIADARRAGRLPVVVPRDPALDEHVDDHQQRFARWMAERGQVRLALTESDLVKALDTALTDPAALRCDAGTDGADAASLRFGDLVEGLLA
jgi:UDP-N-acetylglucosamine transferase subunit ALG13